MIKWTNSHACAVLNRGKKTKGKNVVDESHMYNTEGKEQKFFPPCSTSCLGSDQREGDSV